MSRLGGASLSLELRTPSRPLVAELVLEADFVPRPDLRHTIRQLTHTGSLIARAPAGLESWLVQLEGRAASRR